MNDAMETGLAGGTKLPFERAAGESERAFACFQLFLELGEERMLLALAENTRVSLYTIKRWAWRYEWEERVNMYYEWAEQEPELENKHGRASQESAARRSTPCDTEERKVGERLRRAAERALRRFGCEQQTRKMGLGEIARTFATAFRLERPEADKMNGKDENGLTPEESAALDREFDAAIEKILEAERAKKQEKMTNARSEDGGPRTEDRDQRSEGGDQDGEMQNAECRMQSESDGIQPVVSTASLVTQSMEQLGDQAGVASETGMITDGPTGPLTAAAEPPPPGTGEKVQDTTGAPGSTPPSAALVGVSVPPPNGKKKKPPQHTPARREWVRKKYGYLG